MEEVFSEVQIQKASYEGPEASACPENLPIPPRHPAILLHGIVIRDPKYGLDSAGAGVLRGLALSCLLEVHTARAPLRWRSTEESGTLPDENGTRRRTSMGRRNAAALLRGRSAMLTSLSLAAGCVDAVGYLGLGASARAGSWV